MVGTWSVSTKLRVARGVLVAAVVAVLAALLPWISTPASGAGLAFTYTPIAPMPFGTNEAESVVLGDQLYIFGGFDTTKATFTPTNRAWRYDPAANKWTALPPMPNNGITHSGIATDGVRYIYYAGGSASADNATQQVFGTVDAWRYDTVTGTYTALPDMPEARSAGGLGYVAGKLYYFGGNNLTRTVDGSETWMLDLTGGATSWVSEASLPDPRNHVGFATMNGQIYAVGGQYGSDSRTAQGALDRYDPASNTWTVLPSMPLPRGHVMDSTFVLDGDLVVAGGWTASNVSAAVLAYDPVANSWSAWPNLPEARTSTTVKGISGGRFVFCCGSAGTSAQTGWIANPTGTPVTTPTTPPTTPVVTPTHTSQPQPVTSTTAPTTTPAPTTSSKPPVAPIVTPSPTTSSAPPVKLTLTSVAVHPSTVRASIAGTAQVSYKLSRSAKVTLTLQQCFTNGCFSIDKKSAAAPKGVSHVSLHALTGKTKLPVAHYRVLVATSGVTTVTLHVVVTAG